MSLEQAEITGKPPERKAGRPPLTPEVRKARAEAAKQQRQSKGGSGAAEAEKAESARINSAAGILPPHLQEQDKIAEAAEKRDGLTSDTVFQVLTPEDKFPENETEEELPRVGTGDFVSGPVDAPERKHKARATSGAPSAKEWEDFIGRVLIKTALNAYANIRLRDLELTPLEVASIEISAEDSHELAAPFANAVAKSDFGKKYGRQVLALSDSAEAMFFLIAWTRRVNKIARKHKPKHAKADYQVVPPEQNHHAQETEPVNGENNGFDGQIPGTWQGYFAPFPGGFSGGHGG